MSTAKFIRSVLRVFTVPSESAIEVDSLGKRYGDTVAVTDLSLEVLRGEIFGFLGPNLWCHVVRISGGQGNMSSIAWSEA